MQPLGVLSLISETPVARFFVKSGRRLVPLLMGSRTALEGVRFPNAALVALVLGPTIAVGISLSDHTSTARENALTSMDSVSVALGFGVGSVTIDGLRDTRERDVLDYLAVSDQTSLLRFDLAKARERVLALPWVADASIRRALPDKLYVELAEHEPFARLLQRGRIRLVTVQGEEITDEIVSPHDELPLVVGEGAPQYVQGIFGELASWDQVLPHIQALELVGQRRWTLHMRGDVHVHLPEVETAGALDQLDAIMRDYDILEREVAEIDLRRADHLVVRLTDRAVELLGSVDEEGGA
ncbi:MAG: FtsQ-type POTRA domain-containing protein [Pseudomonadota bacterium]